METEIRYARKSDIKGMAEVYARAWKVGYSGILPEDYLESLSPMRWERSYEATLGKKDMPKAAVMVRDGRIIGVTSFSKSRDEDLSPCFGEVISLYLLPEYWSRGYGAKLLAFAIGKLKMLGFNTCTLWTLLENKRAQRLYECFGFIRDGSEKPVNFGGGTFRCIRYRKEI